MSVFRGSDILVLLMSRNSIAILKHPQDCEVAISSHVELKCKARLLNSKIEEPDYLWYKDGEPLIGEISSECVLEEAGEGGREKYFCLVSHPNGDSSRQSHTAEVTLKSGNGGFRFPSNLGVNLIELATCLLNTLIVYIYSMCVVR